MCPASFNICGLACGDRYPPVCLMIPFAALGPTDCLADAFHGLLWPVHKSKWCNIIMYIFHLAFETAFLLPRIFLIFRFATSFYCGVGWGWLKMILCAEEIEFLNHLNVSIIIIDY